MAHSSPMGAVLRGVLAGAAGTAVMDLFWHGWRQLRGETATPPSGGGPSPASRASTPPPALGTGTSAWPDEESDEEWSLAPTPAQVGKQFYEGVTQRTLEARFARVAGTAVHWAYGMWWGGVFGLAVGSTRRRRTAWGPLFGAAVWGTSYLLLPVTGLYRPIWESRPAELAPDLAAHLIYGTGTAVAFGLMARDRS